MSEKALDNTSTADTQNTTNDIKVFGNPDLWVLICKASSKSQGWMKSTKAMQTSSGVFLRVTSEFTNKDGTKSINEAVSFAPGVEIVEYPPGNIRLA